MVGKAFVDLTPVLEKLRQLGKRVIVDVCDNIYEPPEDGLKRVYTSILPLANTIVAASDNLAAVLKDRVGGNVSVIPDHVEGSKLTPSFNPVEGKLRLLWFGYPNNLDLLHLGLPALGRLAAKMTVELSIVTRWDDKNARLFEDAPAAISIRRINWSLENMSAELARCDIVIIPSSLGPGRLTKTANRLMTGLYAGKYVAAYPLPAYLDFASFVSLDEDLARAVTFALENPTAVARRIADGQDYIDRFYSPTRISGMWEAVLVDGQTAGL